GDHRGAARIEHRHFAQQVLAFDRYAAVLRAALENILAADVLDDGLAGDRRAHVPGDRKAGQAADELVLVVEAAVAPVLVRAAAALHEKNRIGRHEEARQRALDLDLLAAALGLRRADLPGQRAHRIERGPRPPPHHAHLVDRDGPVQLAD